MAVNLAANIRDAIECAIPTIHCCLDSSVSLYWILNRSEYQQFAANRVQTINSHSEVIWYYVPTHQNPAEIGRGSRGKGYQASVVELWPPWRTVTNQWPANFTPQPSDESKAEAKATKKSLLLLWQQMTSVVFWRKTACGELFEWEHRWRSGSWSIVENQNQVAFWKRGSLTTEVTDSKKICWIKKIQAKVSSSLSSWKQTNYS